MRIQSLVAALAVLAPSTVLITSLFAHPLAPGHIRVEGVRGEKLRIRANTDGNVTLVSAATVYDRAEASVDVLAPAEFAIKPGTSYYIRFDAADSAATIDVSAEGGARFGFGSLGSRYTGVSVVCGSPRGSLVRPLSRATSLADRSCPE